MTELLHMKDNYIKECDAEVLVSAENYIVLDRSCFYPEGGGQPSDKGFLIWEGRKIEVSRVAKEKGIVKHYVSEVIPVGSLVHCHLDWDRRYKHMRMHSAEHLLSAIVLDNYGAEVAGNQIGTERSRVDFKPFKPDRHMLEDIVNRFNRAVDEAREIRIEMTTREDMIRRVDERRRRMFERLPSFIKDVRLVVIDGYDIDPCAGTHVRNTKEIGHINIIKTENKGADTTRLIFTLE
ncbi:alanyl-tRNA editing protein AlaX [Candidatus Micrarchaeota archaeon]|nr:MAG: alanyl-tRNA editing protein AlaX [Candidatus Micrarchaeota archaeon]